MKKFYTFILMSTICITTYSQESMEKVMEKRAREMHRVISVTDREQWKKFIKENYTQALIDKPMRASVKGGPDATPASSDVKASDNLEAKVKMFERLHNDFGASKIASIKSEGETLKMSLENSVGMSGTFQLKFDKNKPYLIDGVGIQAEN